MRCRIHSSFVSIKSEMRSFVTTLSGTNIPDPRMTVVGAGISERIICTATGTLGFGTLLLASQ